MDRASARNEHYLELLKDLRLMDDDFFSEALDEKIEPVEYILCTILEREDIKVQHTEAQVEYKSATKRSIKLDIRAVDADGHVMDIEVQRADKGASVRRANLRPMPMPPSMPSPSRTPISIAACAPSRMRIPPSNRRSWPSGSVGSQAWRTW